VIVLVLTGVLGTAFVRLYCPRRLKRLDQLDPFVGKQKRPRLF